MKKLVNTLDLSHEEWLEWRRKGIGGSDAAAICGLNPWRSSVRVYLDKVEPPAMPEQNSERMRIGSDLEDYVAKRFEEATGKKVRRNNFMMVHDDHEFMMANIDREVVGENALLECKTTNSFAKKDWEDGKTPLHYEIQCHHYMAVTGAERVYIACLLGNEAFVWNIIERDEDTIQYLIELESRFWNDHVLAKEPPAPDGSEDYDNILKERFKDSIDEMIELDTDLEYSAKRSLELSDLAKEIKTEKDMHDQIIKKALGNHERGMIGAREVTWKSVTRNDVDKKQLKEEYPDVYAETLKSSSYRRFSISK